MTGKALVLVLGGTLAIAKVGHGHWQEADWRAYQGMLDAHVAQPALVERYVPHAASHCVERLHGVALPESASATLGELVTFNIHDHRDMLDMSDADVDDLAAGMAPDVEAELRDAPQPMRDAFVAATSSMMEDYAFEGCVAAVVTEWIDAG